MAERDLRQNELDLAFAFARSEPAPYRSFLGQLWTAPVDAPRFDHDAGGAPLGLLVESGSDLGLGDRLSLDPLILPAELVEAGDAGTREATIFHVFAREVAVGQDETVEHRAWYTRNAVAAVDALMRQPGHHRSIGVIAGFRENLGGFVRYRGQVWLLTGYLAAGNGILASDDLPLITAGAAA